MPLIRSELWQRASPLLDELLEIDPPERTRRLRALAAEDPALVHELERFLSAGARAESEGFLTGDAMALAESPSLAGLRIGPYVIEAALGEGGAGSVWRARRADGRAGPPVAIKLLHLSLLGRTGGLRFEREGAILARLTHPNIARLLDAGIAPGGQPYLVLDLVEGETIDRHADLHRLGIDARLALFDAVLAAVAHAHSHLVVHRDIKPSNILVDTHGHVKLLDFGIAKLLEQTDAGATRTATGHRAMTPHHAAPEQLQGLPVTTATDVYALGVLLYQLLVGRHPTAADPTRVEDAWRATLDVEPLPLTKALAQDPQAAEAIAAQRGTTVARLRQRLRGDLENIVDRMLRKAPHERYQTVAAVAEDLRRHRRNEPVSARPDSFGYRLVKLVRRRRGIVIAGTAAVLSLAVGLVGTISQAQRAQQERDYALRQLSYAESGNEFITFLLDQAGGDKPFTTAQLLARGEQLVERQFAADPALRARLQMHLSGLYAQAGGHAPALRLLQQARGAAEGSGDTALRSLIDCALAWQAHETGSGAAALASADAAIATLRAEGGRNPDRSALAECLLARSQLHFVRQDDARAARDLEAALAELGTPRPDQRTLAVRIRSTLAVVQHRRGQAADAVRTYEHMLSDLAAMGRGDTQLAAVLSSNLGALLSSSGQTLRAREASARAIAIQRDAGETDPVVEAVYAKVLSELGDEASARASIARALEQARRSGNPRMQAIALHNAAAIALAAHDDATVEAHLREVEAAAGAGAPGRLTRAALRAEVALARGDAAGARRLVDAALADPGATPRTDPSWVRARIVAAAALRALGDLTQAQAQATQAVADARGALGGFAHSRWVGLALLELGRVEQARGDAAAARAAWSEALEHLRASEGEAGPTTATVRAALRSA